MKGQQLFHSFLPSVTVAVLTTQSAWANTPQVDQVKPISVPSFASTTDFNNSVVNNKQQTRNSVHSSSALLLESENKSVGLKTANNNNVAKLTLIKNAEIKAKTKTKTILPIALTNSKVVKQTSLHKCLQLDKQNQADAAFSTGECSQTKTPTTKVAQVSEPAATTNSTPTLENLNPSPNPLLFPTKPEEVKLQENQPLTLEQALELAKRNNNELQVSVLELERSQSALKEAQAALLPTVSVNGRVSNSRSTNSTLGAKQAQQLNPNAPDAEANTAFDTQAQLRYDLYTSGRRNAAITEAEERVRVQELEVERQFEEIRLSVATDYYNLQQADENVRISRSAVENSEASLRDAVALERAGVGTRFDVLRSQVNLANAQQDLTNALSQQAISRRRLAVRLNVPQSINIAAADPVQLAGLWERSLEDSIILAYQNRPELQQQLAQRNISEQQRKQALASLGPQISLVASYDLLDIFNDNINVSDGYSVGVQATINLFDGGAAKARAAQAKKNMAIAETQFTEQRNQIRFQVEQAYSTQISNLENVQTANVALEQAKESLRLARLRFQAGVGTQTDVINAENELTRSEGNRVRAILDYNRALIELQRHVTSRAFQK
ncbi:MAG: TolC family protein [Nostocales cyanobacterium]|nr:MAG: TolC family protein [Nostocales cyanobacterium]TAF14310.1 MAG: TolC family protein [Nostocales cyanobacterium]